MKKLITTLLLLLLFLIGFSQNSQLERQIASNVNESRFSTTGAVVSTTVIVWVVEAELPEESVAVQVTIVSPSGNTSGASLVIDVSWISIIWGNSKDEFVPCLVFCVFCCCRVDIKFKLIVC